MNDRSVARPLLVMLGGGIVISWTIVASVHAVDRFMVGWSEGAQMALARSAANGVLYPPLFDGSSFGGTRTMPIPVLLQGGSSLLVHDQLLASKLITYLGFVLLEIILYGALRSTGSSSLTAFGLTMILAATRLGMATSLRISPDALALALQLGAVTLVSDTRSDRRVAIAAFLSSAAFFSRLSALWAPLAIATWLAIRDRRSAWRFAAIFGACSGVLAALFHVASNGRFEENIVSVALAGVRPGPDLHWAWMVIAQAPATAFGVFMLLPIAIFGTRDAIRQRRWTAFHLAAGYASIILLVVLTDRGATTNHLLDVSVLAIVLAGHAIAHGVGSREVVPGLPLAGLVLLLVLALSALTSLAPTTARAVNLQLTAAEDLTYGRRPLDGLLDPGDRILSEDPTVPLELGMHPVILDPFMLPAIASDHPEWIALFVDRIQNRAFDAVVLVRDLENAPEEWYSRVHLGPAVVDAIRENYQLQVAAEGYFVYRPIPTTDRPSLASAAPPATPTT